jgi:putative membrane protein
MTKTLGAVLAAIAVTFTTGRVPFAQHAMMTDGQVLALFDEANTADIWTGRLAFSKARSTEVRNLGAMVIADHEAVQQMARELAKKQRISATPPANDDSAKALAASVALLQSKSGDEFDRAYLAHELKFHRDAIAAVKSTLLPAASNEELKALLTTVLAGFEHHLAETRRVADALGVK